MRWSRELIVIVLSVAFACTGVAGKNDASDKKDGSKDPAKTSKKDGDKKSGDKKDKKKSGDGKGDSKQTAQGDDKDAKDNRMSVPIIKGHPSKGLKIPYFGSDGKLQMTFAIGTANRLDDNHVHMDDMEVVTYDDAGKREMIITLPESILDLGTRILTTDKSVLIKRSDFEITGKTMEFDTQTKQGKLGGNVRMLIYNMQNELPKERKADE